MKLLEITSAVEPPSDDWRRAAAEHLDKLAIPRGSLGRLLEIARELAAMRRTLSPSVAKKVIVTMAGDHGVVEEGVSAFPQSVTGEMVANFARGGAAVNALAGAARASVAVVDMGAAADLSGLVSAGKVIDRKIAPGTRNMTRGPAMTREQAVISVERGAMTAIELIDDGAELLGTGDMGIGNTTPSSAILSVIGNIPAKDASGRGTGMDDAGLQRKITAVERAIAVNRPDPNDAIDVLSKVGGFEIGGIAGLILGAASRKIPVIVDGFISTAGAMIARGISRECVGYIIPAHRSAEAGHRAMWEELGLRPLLDLDMRLGEGTGAALAMNIVESAARVISGVLTFEQAGVTQDG
ncbi:nicotinate-nucleotide--dimethylbenzimidazole phosphoribosyltransferase [Synergistales bacterium]|nr:nicotinate-nucleotide--dimethylbenzimidazole phosphoribosyltransferase [Synergistales bacterium]